MTDRWDNPASADDDEGAEFAPAPETLPGVVEGDEGGTPVGAADRDADAVRTGAQEAVGGEQDTEGVPTGTADADEDARRTGAD